MPPDQRPLRRDAAILSRVRSEISSRSNCAKLNRIFSMRRPALVAVLIACVTAMKATWCFSNTSKTRVKSISDRLKRSIL